MRLCDTIIRRRIEKNCTEEFPAIIVVAQEAVIIASLPCYLRNDAEVAARNRS
jgi:hypothetical protein